MAKKHVTIHIHDVWLGGRQGETIVVKVPYPDGLSKKQRRIFGDGAADATAKIIDALQPSHRPMKAGFVIAPTMHQRNPPDFAPAA